jgi:hypothetical protein
VTIREFLAMSPDLQHLVADRVLQIYAIVDANVVHAELRWRLGSRENPQARSGLEEALDAGVLVLIAPNFLKLEIEKYLPLIAEQTCTALSDAEQEWKLFQTKLHFYQPSSQVPDGRVVDPKDLPYKSASDELRLPVYTRDAHLAKMGAPVLWVCIDTACRDHARATSVTLGFTMGCTYSLTIGIEAVRAAAKGIKAMFEGFRQLPMWLQLAVAGALAAVAIHPRSRAKVLEVWNSVSATAHDLRDPLLDGLGVVMGQIALAHCDADRTKQEIQAILPPTKKAPAIVHARRICVVCAGPVSIKEIAHRMRSGGYVSRAKNFESYLQRVLRQSGQFVEVSRGVWELRHRSVNQAEHGELVGGRYQTSRSVIV